MPSPDIKDHALESSLARFKAAVVQASPVVFDRERTLERVHLLAGEAARKGAQLVLFQKPLFLAIRGAATLEPLSVREPIRAAKIFDGTGIVAWMFPGPLSTNLRKPPVKNKSIL